MFTRRRKNKKQTLFILYKQTFIHPNKMSRLMNDSLGVIFLQEVEIASFVRPGVLPTQAKLKDSAAAAGNGRRGLDPVNGQGDLR
ncbi:hypothetical protein NDU88_007328 [Pleurodeles waltl]|uniref:Uncharacterized protein n=1 Tax=Pleurodeles waltl TaxID=8319 RepID=A0AAV7VT81_PLEWA|nr:hypothetical protein NDU88_007328 [Pleurodeles waltl]